MTYKYIYKTPEKLSNMIMNSDGEYLTGLWFEGSRNSIMRRCKWCNLNNPKYIEYHDKEWCKPNYDEKYLYEMLILESFQAGLSWECVLNKRDDFKKAFDNFDIDKINFRSSFVEQINKLYDKGVVDFPTMLERNGKFEVQKENCSLKNQIELKDAAIKGLKENLYYEK
mgnify:CR=1 FL=1